MVEYFRRPKRILQRSRPFFTQPTLTGIAQALCHAVEGEVRHLQQVGVAACLHGRLGRFISV